MIKLPWAVWAAAALTAMPATAQVTVPPASIRGPAATADRRGAAAPRPGTQQRKGAGRTLEAGRTAAPAPARPPPTRCAFPVRQIRFTESAILAPGELDALAAPYLGRELRLADLCALAARWNRLYIAVAAWSPPRPRSRPRTSLSGVVTIRLVEGRLGRCWSTATTPPMRITWRTGSDWKPSDPWTWAGWKRRDPVQPHQRRPGAGRTEAGKRFATTDIEVAMAEPPRHDLRVTADNLGAAATGRNRVGLCHTNRSLPGLSRRTRTMDTRATGPGTAGPPPMPSGQYLGRPVESGHYADKTAVRERSPGIPCASPATTPGSFCCASRPGWMDAQVDVVPRYQEPQEPRNWIDKVLSKVDDDDRSVGGGPVVRIPVELVRSYTRSVGHADTTRREGYRRPGLPAHFRDLGGGFSLRGILTRQSTPQANLTSGEQFFSSAARAASAAILSGSFPGDKGQVLSLELHHPLFGTRADGMPPVPVRRQRPRETLSPPIRRFLRANIWAASARPETPVDGRRPPCAPHHRAWATLPAQMPRSNEVTLCRRQRLLDAGAVGLAHPGTRRLNESRSQVPSARPAVQRTTSQRGRDPDRRHDEGCHEAGPAAGGCHLVPPPARIRPSHRAAPGDGQ